MKKIALPVAAKIGSLAKAVGVSPVTRNLDGFAMKLDLEQSIDAKLCYTRQHEPSTIQAIKRLVQPGHVAVDVGANIGFITLTLARIVGESGKVYAFEPSDWTFERLKRNVELNDLGNVEVVAAGVGAESNDEVAMTLPCGYRLDGKDTATKQTVRVCALDDYVGDQHIDFIKIDTDGWEAAVIAGAHRLIERDHPTILFELCPDHARDHGFDPMTPIESLASLGYRFTLDTGEDADAQKIIDSLPTHGSANLVATCG